MIPAIQRKKAAEGFTLIELMIVIAIIAILAAVAIPNFMRARDRAKLSSCVRSSGDTWRNALEMYANIKPGNTILNNYPSELDTGATFKTGDNLNILVAALGAYTNVTGAVKDCGTVSFDMTTEGYTVVGVAKNKAQSILTASETAMDMD